MDTIKKRNIKLINLKYNYPHCQVIFLISFIFQRSYSDQSPILSETNFENTVI